MLKILNLSNIIRTPIAVQRLIAEKNKELNNVRNIKMD